MSRTIELLKNYVPYNEQEAKDKQYFIDCERKNQILTRENELCHLCSSAFIINKNHNKVLCIYHNIYNSWSWVGGHADGDDDMLYVAKKETQEETSIKNFRVLYKQPISIDSLPVAGHFKRGKYVSAHTHLSFAYLFEADESETIHIKEDENSKIGWLTFNELLSKSTESHMILVYKKILEKIDKLIKENKIM